jgi:hypothetical protein
MLAVISITPAWADAPLPPAKDTRQCNRAGTFCAEASVAQKATTLYRVEGDKRTPVWSVPGWMRSFFVSEDGKYLARGYGGINLLSEADYKPTTVMVEFFAEGKSVLKVTLGELVKDLSTLRRTVSHYAWGVNQGFDPDGAFMVRLDNDTVVKIDPAKWKGTPGK